MRIKHILFIILYLFVQTSCNKNNIKKSRTQYQFTQAQMYADFDFLTVSITNVYCRIDLIKEGMGLDIVAELKQLRNQISNVSKLSDFLILVKKALTITQDKHNTFLTSGYEYWDSAIKGRDSYKYSKIMNKYHNLIPNINIDIPVMYYDGEYYVYAGFTNNTTAIVAGDKLVQIDSYTIHDYVAQLYMDRSLMWDFKNQRYYDNHFFQSTRFYFEGTHQLSFQDVSKRSKVIAFNSSKPLNFSTPHYFSTSTAKVINHSTESVLYFTNHQILYVRKRTLGGSSSINRAVKNIFKNQKVSKVVLDFRDSQGGKASFLINLLLEMYDSPIKEEKIIGMKKINDWFTNISFNSNRYGTVENKYIGDYTNENNLKQSYSVYKQTIVRNKYSGNAHFSGKTYILLNENTFSAPIVFQYTSRQWENVITVGQPTAYESGGGMSGCYYEYFILPNSGIVYRIVNGINLENPEMLFKLTDNAVDIPVNMSWEEKIFKMYYNGDVYGKEYLLNHDVLIKKIVDL